MDERKRDVHKIHHQLFVVTDKLVGRLTEIKAAQEPPPPDPKKKPKDEDYIDE